jgi:glutaminyl-tRNA synthetase
MVTTPGTSFVDGLNPHSLEVIPHAFAELCLGTAAAGDRYQFERLGYFVRDTDMTGAVPVFNKTLGLKDTWAKEQKKVEQNAC